MAELDIPPEFLRNLILKIRALLGKEGRVMPASGNAADDGMATALQDAPGDMLRQEVVEEIAALDRDHMHEIVALMWLGRGDFGADEWEEAVALAADRHQGPVAEYLLSHPQVADHLLEGLDALYDGTDLLETGRY